MKDLLLNGMMHRHIARRDLGVRFEECLSMLQARSHPEGRWWVDHGGGIHLHRRCAGTEPPQPIADVAGHLARRPGEFVDEGNRAPQ
ncbi:hypothetical protein DBR36_00220 [Microbacterium sp. HMWF026]|nr:hypothetical protein DBR36_00220 [Microbacterium sp. HMWF026]